MASIASGDASGTIAGALKLVEPDKYGIQKLLVFLNVHEFCVLPHLLETTNAFFYMYFKLMGVDPAKMEEMVDYTR